MLAAGLDIPAARLLLGDSASMLVAISSRNPIVGTAG